MANRVNNDPGRLWSIEYYVRIWTYHETAELGLGGGASTVGVISEYVNDVE